MFSNLKESTIFVGRTVATFLMFFLFGLVSLFDWSKGFAPVAGAYGFFIPKIIIIVIGLLVTNIPLWLLVLLSFLPVRIIAPLFFVAFILALAHF